MTPILPLYSKPHVYQRIYCDSLIRDWHFFKIISPAFVQNYSFHEVQLDLKLKLASSVRHTIRIQVLNKSA